MIMADWSNMGPPRSLNGTSSTVTETSGPAASNPPLATPASAASGSPQQGGAVNNRLSIGGNTNRGKLQEIGQIDVTASASHPGADIGNNTNERDVQKVAPINVKLTGKDEDTRDKGGCSIV